MSKNLQEILSQPMDRRSMGLLIENIVAAKKISLKSLVAKDVTSYQIIETKRAAEKNARLSKDLIPVRDDLLEMMKNYEKNRNEYPTEKLKQQLSSVFPIFFESAKKDMTSSSVDASRQNDVANDASSASKSLLTTDSARNSMKNFAEVKLLVEKITDYKTAAKALRKMYALCTADNHNSSPNLVRCLIKMADKLKDYVYVDDYYFVVKFKEAMSSVEQIAKQHPGMPILFFDKVRKHIVGIYGSFDNGWILKEVDLLVQGSHRNNLYYHDTYNFKKEGIYLTILAMGAHLHYGDYAEANYSEKFMETDLDKRIEALSEKIKFDIEMFSRHYFDEELLTSNPQLAVFNDRLEQYHAIKKECLRYTPESAEYWPLKCMLQGKKNLAHQVAPADITDIDALFEREFSFYERLNVYSKGDYWKTLAEKMESLFVSSNGSESSSVAANAAPKF